MNAERESVFAYARREGWREGLRVGVLRIVQPFVFPIYRFVDRNYHTEARLRLAKVSGTAMWWRIKGDDYEFRGDDPRTPDEVIDRLYDYADRAKPLADVGKRP